jgi:cytochrome P450
MSINSNTAIKQIYGFKSNVRKSVFYHAFPAYRGHPSIQTAVDKKVHARKQRVLGQGFSENAIRGLEPQILACTEALSRQLSSTTSPDARLAAGGGDEAPWGVVSDMGAWVHHFTFDVMGGMVFSKSYRTLENDENRWMQDAIQETGRIKYSTGFWPLLHETGLDKVVFPKLASIRARVKAFAVKQLKERIEAGKMGEKRDLVYFLGNAKDPETGEGLSLQELGSEAALLIVAGNSLSIKVSSTLHSKSCI